jgi:hypothetical protein
MIMAKECENCAYKSDFKSPECGTCMVSYYDGEQLGLPSNFKQKPQTNADRIRAMSDEELAVFLRDVEYDVEQYPFVQDWDKWLKQPAEGE